MSATHSAAAQVMTAWSGAATLTLEIGLPTDLPKVACPPWLASAFHTVFTKQSRAAPIPGSKLLGGSCLNDSDTQFISSLYSVQLAPCLDDAGAAAAPLTPGLGSTAVPEPAGVIDNPGTPLASGASAAAGPSAPDVDSSDAPAVESDGEQQGPVDAAGSVKEQQQPSAGPPVQSLDQAKVHSAASSI